MGICSGLLPPVLAMASLLPPVGVWSPPPAVVEVFSPLLVVEVWSPPSAVVEVLQLLPSTPRLLCNKSSIVAEF